MKNEDKITLTKIISQRNFEDSFDYLTEFNEISELVEENKLQGTEDDSTPFSASKEKIEFIPLDFIEVAEKVIKINDNYFSENKIILTTAQKYKVHYDFFNELYEIFSPRIKEKGLQVTPMYIGASVFSIAPKEKIEFNPLDFMIAAEKAININYKFYEKYVEGKVRANHIFRKLLTQRTHYENIGDFFSNKAFNLTIIENTIELLNIKNKLFQPSQQIKDNESQKKKDKEIISSIFEKVDVSGLISMAYFCHYNDMDKYILESAMDLIVVLLDCEVEKFEVLKKYNELSIEEKYILDKYISDKKIDHLIEPFSDYNFICKQFVDLKENIQDSLNAF